MKILSLPKAQSEKNFEPVFFLYSVKFTIVQFYKFCLFNNQHLLSYYMARSKFLQEACILAQENSI